MIWWVEGYSFVRDQPDRDVALLADTRREDTDNTDWIHSRRMIFLISIQSDANDDGDGNTDRVRTEGGGVKVSGDGRGCVGDATALSSFNSAAVLSGRRWAGTTRSCQAQPP